MDDALLSPFAQASEAGTQPASTFNPNMFGDLLGARAMRIGFVRTLNVRFPAAFQSGGTVLDVFSPGAQIQLIPLPGTQGTPFPNRLPPSNFEGPFGQLATLDQFTQQLVAGNVIPPQEAQTARAVIQSVLSGRNLTPEQVAALPSSIRSRLPEIQNAINREITRATNGATIPSLTVGPVSGSYDGTNLLYTTTLTGEVLVALPAAGGTVGRLKMSEDNNPLPRDRFIFNHDTFSNVPFTTDGVDVNRFQFGVEKTFLDGRASLEFRLPFAGTLASSTVQGFETTATELGNVRFAAKYLWMQGPLVALSTGLGVTLPTARDQVMFDAIDGSELYRFENESVTVEPFVGLLLTPSDRLFGQVWSSVNFDTSGGRLTYDPAVFGGSGTTRFWDVPYLAVDSQIGYWLVQREYGAIRGLAPFLELHWNYALAQSRLDREINKRTMQQGLTVKTVAPQELNLSAGLTTLIGDNLSVAIGGAAPLMGSNYRTFDGQFGIRVNYFFGRTARERSSAYRVSGY
jgi:hypothetical protein